MRRICVLLLLLYAGVASAQTAAHEVAITFDDLPKVVVHSPNPAGDINDLRATTWLLMTQMAGQQATATGFVNESKLYVPGEVQDRAQLLQMWLDAGMELGNHGYEHLRLQDTPLAQYEENVIRGEAITRWLSAGAMPRYYRFPFNSTGATAEIRDAFRDFLQARAYSVAPFTIENSDYMFNEIYVRARHARDYRTAEQVRAAYLDYTERMFEYFEGVARQDFGRDIRQVLLIHANDINADVLDALLARVAKRGYRFVTLERALQDPAYHTPDQYAGPYGISWLHRWKPALGLPLKYNDPGPPKWVVEAYEQPSAARHN